MENRLRLENRGTGSQHATLANRAVGAGEVAGRVLTSAVHTCMRCCTQLADATTSHSATF
eukprot:5891221-Amphidinium_carterae.1